MPPTPPAHKSVSFCAHCQYHREGSGSGPDLRYYSDPEPDERKSSPDSDLKYYSEPDVKYFEIDYEFLKELRRIARTNCPKCSRKRKPRAEHPSGRSHVRGPGEHCPVCCGSCARSTDTLVSTDDDRLAAHDHPAPATRTDSRPKSSTPRNRERNNSIHSNKSVSFLESTNDESRNEETNYTAKSFTNDLKKFLLKPSPRLSLRDKFFSSFKQEIEATKRSPKLKAIKGLWKSY